MSLKRLMICITVGLSLSSVAALAAGPRSNPLKSPPVAARHHAAYKPIVKAEKQPRKHFWDKK
jgi:hypothetical protein